MPQVTTVSRQRHAGKRWQRYTSYAFASHSAVVPLVAAEIQRAVLALPVAFMRQGEAFVPVAVMGLEPGRNLLIDDRGRWRAGYIPAAVRGYPFSLVRGEQNQLVLCIDEGSGLITEGPDGEAFFDESGELAAGLREATDFLRQVERNRTATARSCAKLEDLGLIQPWPISFEVGQGKRRQIEGLFKIEESRLDRLDAEVLVELRDAGGLALAYYQILSRHNLELLGRLAEAHAQPGRASSTPSTDLFSQSEDDLLEFDWDAMTKQ